MDKTLNHNVWLLLSYDEIYIKTVLFPKYTASPKIRNRLSSHFSWNSLFFGQVFFGKTENSLFFGQVRFRRIIKFLFFWKNAISGKDKKIQFSKNTLRSNHKIPYFEDKACFAKPWNSLFFGEVLFAENTKFLIFWTPYFRWSTVCNNKELDLKYLRQ